MAGDWIKVEHSTFDKAEVRLIAELLGVKPAHAFGLVIQFWQWLDRNSCNGVVTHVSRGSIDAIVAEPGFAASMEAVEWLTFAEGSTTATVPNFERHNGSSAKTRALTRDRVKRSRNADVTRDASPENRGRDRTTPVVPDGFAEFWLLYPRKDKKASALQAWKRLAPDGALQNRIAADVRRRTAGFDWTKEGGTFIPHPASYLNSKRWEDEGTILPTPAKRVVAS